MAFTDHKIDAFTHKISDLADQPNLPPDELKARFDSSPEELRQAVNAICDDAARLDTRVSGIITGTFTDAVTESMLSEELQDKLGAKADQTAVTQQIASESSTRESADDALSSRIDTLDTNVSARCKIYTGHFNGDGQANRVIYLPASPKALILSPPNFLPIHIVLQGESAKQDDGSFVVQLVGSKLTLMSTGVNQSGKYYRYILLT